MKTRGGFTLIELLAVIVILAVIALIATPIIMNVINDSKNGAAKDAMYGYVKAVELAGAKAITPTTDAPTGEYTTKNGNLYAGETKVMDVTLKGTKPEDDFGSVTLKDGQVIDANLKFDGIEVDYDGKEATVVDKDALYKEYAHEPTIREALIKGTMKVAPKEDFSCTANSCNYTGTADTAIIPLEYATKTNGVNINNGNTTTKKIVFPIGTTYIGDFRYTSLEEVIMPDSVTEMISDAFREISTLKKVILSKSLKAIPDNAFANDISLATITIPGSVKVIGTCSFSYSGLTSIIFEEGIEEIGYSAFDGTSLSGELVLPASLKTVPGEANFGNTKIKAVRLKGATVPQTDYGFLYTFSSVKTLYYPVQYEAYYKSIDAAKALVGDSWSSDEEMLKSLNESYTLIGY